MNVFFIYFLYNLIFKEDIKINWSDFIIVMIVQTIFDFAILVVNL